MEVTCDTAAARIARPAPEVFAFVTDPDKLSLWSFGTWRTEIDATGLVRGRSIKDGATIFLRIAPHPGALLADYHVGTSPEALAPRIFIRVVSGEAVGDPSSSILTMTALRSPGMDEARWSALKAAHAVEVDLIRAALETGYDHRRA